jgi:hypothetical protein
MPRLRVKESLTASFPCGGVSSESGLRLRLGLGPGIGNLACQCRLPMIQRLPAAARRRLGHVTRRCAGGRGGGEKERRERGCITTILISLKREMSGMAQRYMRGDATRMEAYIKLGSMVYNYNHGIDIFNRPWPSRAIIEGMHEAFFGLPDGNHQEEIVIHVPKVYMDPIDHILPSGEARDHGPPDWVSGPEGIRITDTREDVTAPDFPFRRGV